MYDCEYILCNDLCAVLRDYEIMNFSYYLNYGSFCSLIPVIRTNALLETGQAKLESEFLLLLQETVAEQKCLYC